MFSAFVCIWPEDRVNTHGAKSVMNKKEHRFIKSILFYISGSRENAKQCHEKGIGFCLQNNLTVFALKSTKLL